MPVTKTANQPQDERATKKTFKRRRCENCNKLYAPTREDQRFCRTDGDNCRKEFHRYGSSYGPLKTGLHKAIDKKCAELREEFRRLKRIVDALTKEVEHFYSEGAGNVAVELKQLRAEVEMGASRFNGHTHDVVEENGIAQFRTDYKTIEPTKPTQP